MRLNIAVFYGSVRSERQGIKAARFIVNKCEERGHEVSLIDPKKYSLPLLDKMYKEYKSGKAPETLQKIANLIIPADTYIIVSGEYNHTIPPALANLLDHFLEEYFYKPSAIVCYSAGSFGGVRASIALRSILAELGMPSIPSVFPIPKVQDAFDDSGRAKVAFYDQRVGKFLEELEWYATALKDARAKQEACRSYCEAQELAKKAASA
jgi:NAD(P)H-dependent FMN reductase